MYLIPKCCLLIIKLHKFPAIFIKTFPFSFTGRRCRPRNYYFQCQRKRCYTRISKIRRYSDNAAFGLQKCKYDFFLKQ